MYLRFPPLLLIFRRSAKGRKEKKTVMKNGSHWRYETQFIHASLARRRLTTEWCGTSVNLSKWATCQIFATAPALNNLLHFSFYSVFRQLREAQIIATVSCLPSYGATLIKTPPFGKKTNRNTRKENFSFHNWSHHSCSWHKRESFICDSCFWVTVFPIRGSASFRANYSSGSEECFYCLLQILLWETMSFRNKEIISYFYIMLKNKDNNPSMHF